MPLWSFQGAHAGVAHEPASRAGLSKLNSVVSIEVDVASRRVRSPDDPKIIDGPGSLPE
jgi:hypothetical protein